MKEKINQINRSIEETRDRLKEKVERYFLTITVPNGQLPQQSVQGRKDAKTPPISYMLYGVAGLSFILMIASESSESSESSKLLYLAAAAACAYGGYKFSHKNKSNTSANTSSQVFDIDSLKNEVRTKVRESVTKTTKEWEQFMEMNQKEVQSAISSSSLNEAEKDSLLSKVYVYEVIGISLSDFLFMLNAAKDLSAIKQSVASYKVMLLDAIDKATEKQIGKYNSLIG
ncbi:MAG: hypothetical protein L6V92_03075 [Phocaeicola vulgatus]|nr:MAG: hypothetical protein L6V92_03075 [Phocaeicola vulgatus]